MGMFRPPRRGEAGLPYHPFPQRHDKADLFGQRNERARRDHSSQWMVPADQRLKSADLVAREIHHRLVIELELLGRQRLAQILLDDAAGLHLQNPHPLKRNEATAAVASPPL